MSSQEREAPKSQLTGNAPFGFYPISKLPGDSLGEKLRNPPQTGEDRTKE